MLRLVMLEAGERSFWDDMEEKADLVTREVDADPPDGMAADANTFEEEDDRDPDATEVEEAIEDEEEEEEEDFFFVFFLAPPRSDMM